MILSFLASAVSLSTLLKISISSTVLYFNSFKAKSLFSFNQLILLGLVTNLVFLCASKASFTSLAKVLYGLFLTLLVYLLFLTGLLCGYLLKSLVTFNSSSIVSNNPSSSFLFPKVTKLTRMLLLFESSL